MTNHQNAAPQPTPSATPDTGTTPDTARPTPAGLPPHARFPAGRRILVNPGTSAQAISDNLDLGTLIDLIRPGGQVLLRQDPDGPFVNVLLPASDARARWFEAGLNFGQTTAASQQIQPADEPTCEQVIATAGFAIATANIQYLAYNETPTPTGTPATTRPRRHRSRRRPTHRT